MTTTSRTLARLVGATMVAAGSVSSAAAVASASTTPAPTSLHLTVEGPNQVAGRNEPVVLTLGPAPAGLSEVTVADLVPAGLAEKAGSARINSAAGTVAREPRQVATTRGTLLVWRGVQVGRAGETLSFTLTPDATGAPALGQRWTDSAWVLHDHAAVPAGAPWPAAPSGAATTTASVLGGQTDPAVTIQPATQAGTEVGAPVVAVSGVPVAATTSGLPTPLSILHHLGGTLATAALHVPVVEVMALEAADPAVVVHGADIRAERLTIATSPSAGTTDVDAAVYLPSGLTWVRCAVPGTCADPTIHQVRLAVGHDGLPILPAPAHPGRDKKATFTEVAWHLRSVPADATVKVAYLLHVAPGPASYTDLAVASATPVVAPATTTPSSTPATTPATTAAVPAAASSDVSSPHVFELGLQATSSNGSGGTSSSGGILPSSSSQSGTAVNQVGGATTPTTAPSSGTSSGSDPFVPGASTPTTTPATTTHAATGAVSSSSTSSTTTAKASTASAPLAYTGLDVRGALTLGAGLIVAGGAIVAGSSRSRRDAARQLLAHLAPSGA